MDDNILIEGITESSPDNSKGSYDTDPEKMNAIHIIDFSDLSIGEQPINLVPYSMLALITFSCLHNTIK
jgi:hypothetical protein